MSAGLRARLVRRVGRLLRPGGRAVILAYHRIANDVSDPYGLCVAPRQFEEHLDVMRRAGRPFALHALVRAMRNGSVPDRAICITFDDGYADNLDAAKPLLARNDVPATVFMTTGRAGRDREFWWDELQRVLLEPAHLPAVLELTVGDRDLSWELGHEATFARDDPRRTAPWHLLDPNMPTSRHGVFRSVYELLQPLPVVERTRLLDALVAWANVPASEVRASRRALEPDEVATLARDGLVEIGAHTVDHPALPVQPPDVQRREIARSKADLEQWTGRTVAGFAYPYGLYDGSSVAAVREAGFDFACSCEPEAVWLASAPHLLPRIEVPNCSGDVLAEQLGWALDGRISRRPVIR